MKSDIELYNAKLATPEFISRVRTFGALGYTPERIASLMSFHGTNKQDLVYRLTLPDDPLREAYINGNAIGQYNIDVELTKLAETGDTDSIELLSTRTADRQEADLRLKLFGV